MNFNCDDIQDLVVKVYYSIDENKTRESSGVILRPKDETDYFFVLTTRHSFKEKDNQTHKDVDVNSLDASKISLKYKNNEEFQPLKVINTEHDLVVLIIDNPLCKKYDLKQIKILNGTYKNCGLVGYPNIAENELECLDRCTYSISQNEIEFKINTNEPLQSTYHDEVETTKGYSGSGLFTQVNSNYMLTGIISEVISYKNSFKCVNISYLLKDISLDEYGGIEIVSLETISIESSNQLHQETNIIQEEYKTIIQEQVTKEFQALKEQYLDGITKPIQEWIDEIKISTKWSILTDKEKAKIIYEEARISIETNQFQKTKSLVEEIQRLDNDLYVNRLLSWIEIDKNNLDEAIELLDNNEVTTLNQKMAIYLDIDDFDNALKIFDNIKKEDRNHETYRIKAIYEIYNSNSLIDALKNIDKSLKLKNDYIEAKRVKAIILFYQSTPFEILPMLRLPMVQPNTLKVDQESQKNIELTIKIFEEVIELSPQYRDILWLNSILWAVDREKAIRNITTLYQESDFKEIAIQLILIYNLDIDIQEDIEIIESQKNLDIQDIDKLILYYFRKENDEKIFNLLNTYKDIYLEYEFFPSWCEHYVNALLLFSSYQDALSFIDENKFERSDEFKAHIYKQNNDYNSAYKIYLQLFKETKKSLYCLMLCEMKSEENDWNYLTQYTDYLLENFKTEKVVELVILGEINSQNFAKAKKLVDEWLPLIKNQLRRESLLRIKAICENVLGFPMLSMKIYEDNDFTDSDEDIANLAHLYRKTASYEKLETLAVKSINNQNLHIDTKIQMAVMIDDNSTLISEIIKKNNVEKSDVFLIKKDSKNNHKILQRIQKLGDNEILLYNESSGEGTLINLEHEAQKKHNYTLYQNSDISMHHLDKNFLDSYHKENTKTLYIRSAKKYDFMEINDIQDMLLYLDITSLLLLFSLNKLQLIIDSFSKVFLPSNIFFILDDINASSTLRNLLKINFKLEKLSYSPEINRNNLKNTGELSNLLLSIYTLLEFEKENTLICIDDRYVNSFHQTKNKQKIISINDILFTLYQQNTFSKDDYYSTLLEMRKRKYLYLLITSEEIIYQLNKCKIVNNQLEESEDLKALKESLNFMVQNFKYLKPFEQTEIENSKYSDPIFVINQEREIQNSIIDLWNEKFEYEEDRYIHLTWIMDNLFTLNMVVFIKNKLPHNHDISKTLSMIGISSLFLHAITIISSKNQKSYFMWLYHHFLHNFFKANPTLFQEYIDNISFMIIESFFKKEINELQLSTITELIINFPEEIKNRLYKNKQLVAKLPFEEKITIGSLHFENHLFIKKIKKVINGSKIEKVTSDDNQSSTLQLTIIKHKKNIQIITNGDKGIMDNTFMILSTSKQKRRKILEANPQWFNMSNKKKNQLIKEINNIQNHHERIERLYQVQEDSKFYFNLQKDLEKQRLNFDSLIPNNIDILLNHFRLDKDLSFDESFNLSVETLLNEEDISNTIDVIHHFPTSFSQNIIDILKEKSEEEQRVILKSFWKTPTTPISHMQLLKVLIDTQNENFKRLVRYLMKKIFTEEFKLELKAFFAIKNFVKQEFNLKYSSLNNDIKLALIWSHSNKLMKYFNAYSVDYNWIIKEFKARSNMLTLEIFKPESQYNNDILNKSFTHEEFVLTAIDYITVSNFDYFKNTIIEEKLKNLLNTEDIFIKFTPPTHIRYNLTNSFLEFNTSLLSELQNNIQSLEKSLLNDNITLFTSFLSIKYGFTPLEEKLQNQLIKYIKEYQPNKKTLMTLHDLLLFTKQLKNINNKKVFKLVVQYIKDISMNVKTQEERNVLLEILVYLPIAQTDNLKKRIRLITKYIQNCNALDSDEVRFITNRILMELPLEYSNYFLPLKFHTYQKLEKDN